MGNLALSFSHALIGLRTKTTLPSDSVLLIPPVQAGGLGDAALISACAALLRPKRARIDLLCDQRWQQLDEKIDAFVPAEKLFSRPRLLQRWANASYVADYGEINFIGANLSDLSSAAALSERLALLTQAAHQGKSARLLCCSYAGTADPAVLQQLKLLPVNVRVCARDLPSHQLLEKLLQRQVHLTADPALLLQARREHPLAAKALAWVNQERSRGDHVLGLSLRAPALNSAAYIQAVRALLAGLMSKNMSLLLMPFDNRGQLSDAQMLQKIVASFGASARARIYFLPCVSPGIARAVCEDLDLLLCNNYQAALTSLAAATPVLCLDDSDDLSGLLQAFQLAREEMMHAAGRLLANPAAVEEACLDLLARKTLLHLDIHRRLPSLHFLAERNFS